MPKNNWTEDEITLALELYCRTPRERIKADNPDLEELASLIGRSIGSVKAKLWNIAAVDPKELKEGRIAVCHGSKVDREVFNKYQGRWDDLSYRAAEIRALFEGKPVEEGILGIEDDLPIGEDRLTLVKKRIGQSFFRSAVLAAYGGRCCLTGISDTALLVASHIKPWSESSPTRERTNPCNGLALNALYDKAFDQGLITVDLQYRMRVSRRLTLSEMDEVTKRWIVSYDGRGIELPVDKRFRPCKEFLEYHNDKIFLG